MITVTIIKLLETPINDRHNSKIDTVVKILFFGKDKLSSYCGGTRVF
jgi:hypothetical protein